MNKRVDIKEIVNFNIYNKIYRPKFNLGDIVCFMTDDDQNKYLIYAYVIDIDGTIMYRISRNGTVDTAHHYEIKLID
jgi:hypothetical protein